MSREGVRPYTRTRKPEPQAGTDDWVIWAAWADRVSFDEIRERTGLAEKHVIRLMRRSLKPSSFRLWRKRVGGRGADGAGGQIGTPEADGSAARQGDRRAKGAVPVSGVTDADRK